MTYGIVQGNKYKDIGDVTIIVEKDGIATVSISLDGGYTLTGSKENVKWGVYGIGEAIPTSPGKLPNKYANVGSFQVDVSQYAYQLEDE